MPNKETDHKKQSSRRQRRRRLHFGLQLLFTLLILLLPLLIFILRYDPVLTARLADELSYARYMHSLGNVEFPGGWVTTEHYFPLSLRYFCMRLAGKYTEWRSLLLGGLLCTYLLFFAAAFFNVLALRARKWITYIVLAPLLAAAGYIGLLAGCNVHYFLTYAAFALSVSGFLVLGLRSAGWKLPVRILVSLAAGLPVLLLVMKMNSLPEDFAGRDNWFSFAGFSVQTPEKEQDTETRTAGLAAFMTANGLDEVFTTARLDNVLQTVSGGTLSALQIADPAEPGTPACTDCAVRGAVPNEGEYYAPYLIAVEADQARGYEKTAAFSFAEKLYEDADYVLYRFESSEYVTNENLISDLTGLKKEKYDTVFISMYSIENSDPSAFDNYVDWKSYFIDGTVENLRHFEEYNDLIFEKGIKRYYFGVDPMQLWELSGGREDAYKKLLEDRILPVVKRGTGKTEKQSDGISYAFVFPGYYIAHYAGYTEQDLKNMQTAYAELLALFAGYDNITYHFSGDREWLYANKNLFVKGSDTTYTDEIANHVGTYLLANYFLKTPEEVLKSVDDLCQVIKETGGEIKLGTNISDLCTIVLGDSIFGLYKDNTSITSILKLMGGSEIVNQSIGGATAAKLSYSSISLLDQLDTAAIEASVKEAGADWKRKVFMIEFGLNDYFTGTAVDNEKDPLDDTTYAGAIRNAVEIISKKWPDSRILIMSPGFNGKFTEDEKKAVGDGGVLQEYRDAAAKVAEEYKLELVDLCRVGITKETFPTYSDDLVHYNEEGRLLIGKYLIAYLGGQIKQNEE